MNRYSLPEPLLQVMINKLGERPYAEVGELLGRVQQECAQQDQQRAEQEAAQIRVEARKELLAEQQRDQEAAKAEQHKQAITPANA